MLLCATRCLRRTTRYSPFEKKSNSAGAMPRSKNKPSASQRPTMRSQLPCVVCTALLFLVPCVAKAQREASGVGLTLGKHEGGFLVMQVLTNSPACLDGSIKAGDLITAVAQS